MPCDSKPLTDLQREAQTEALSRLEAALSTGSVSVVIGASGAAAFRNWNADERAGLSDVCTMRRLMAANSAALRRAIARAEAVAGRQLDARAIASGVHSHDGGHSWHPGH